MTQFYYNYIFHPKRELPSFTEPVAVDADKHNPSINTTPKNHKEALKKHRLKEDWKYLLTRPVKLIWFEMKTGKKWSSFFKVPTQSPKQDENNIHEWK